MTENPPIPDDDLRPDPDQLLEQVRQEEARVRRGRLKIFFGASAGVGKTYAMLAAARQALAQGVPLVVGLVETHGRTETQALVSGLPLLPLKDVSYRNRSLKEFDLDAALAFGASHASGTEPPLVLLDELAHSNAPESRHPKRWQDIEELLAAGIDVWSTMNVQHLESLNDVVGGITGIRVWETVPDTLFDAADEVVVVDLPPDELLARLAAGKVYMPTQAKHAAAHFFRKGNLIALRELALRRTADRVDSQMQRWRRTTGKTEDGGQPQWSTRDRLLACVGPGPGAETVVRSAARLAAQNNLPWHAVFVDAPALQRVREADRERALRALKLAQELGAITATPGGSDIVQTLVRYARENNLSRLVLGRRSSRKSWRISLTERLAQATPDMDILQVPLPQSDPSGRAAGQARQALPGRCSGYFMAMAACAAVTALAMPLRSVLELTNIVMLFLLVVVGAAVRYGRRPAILAAFLGVALFDFFFVPPLLSFSVSDVQYLITFAVMLLVALVIGQLMASLRAQAHAAAERERRVRGLYQMSRELSAVLLPEQAAEVAARFLRTEFSTKSALLVANEVDQLEIQPGATADVDRAVAQWCFDRGEAAGYGTNTLPASACLMLPLKGPMRLRGVLAVQFAQPAILTPEQRQMLDTCASLLAISIERIHYIRVAQSSTVQIESERLRNSLLSAISHDLRTPLAALTGLADALAMATPPLSEPQAGIIAAIRESTRRMNAQVGNLLDMARLESGTVPLRCEWQPLEEVIGSALATCESSLGKRKVDVQLPTDLPLLCLDASLIERMLVNLLENACKYTPPETAIAIRARKLDKVLRITLDDDGPGLPPGREAALFEKFERGSKEIAASGVGLGLAICRAIAQVHDGCIRGENRTLGDSVVGARFIIELPLGDPPQDDGSRDDDTVSTEGS
ncbi:DUF4118 domain-containing protein [Castellaniella sp. WN]